jgi:hypothetical protein
MSRGHSDLELHKSLAVFEKLQMSAAFRYLDLYFILEIKQTTVIFMETWCKVLKHLMLDE